MTRGSRHLRGQYIEPSYIKQFDQESAKKHSLRGQFKDNTAQDPNLLTNPARRANDLKLAKKRKGEEPDPEPKKQDIIIDPHIFEDKST